MKHMIDKNGITFVAFEDEEEIEALMPWSRYGMEEAGYSLGRTPSAKESGEEAKRLFQEPDEKGSENSSAYDEELEKGMHFHREFRAMRKYIRENQIWDYDVFARYCREHNAGWTELLEDQGRIDTVKGYIKFLRIRKKRKHKFLVFTYKYRKGAVKEVPQ